MNVFLNTSLNYVQVEIVNYQYKTGFLGILYIQNVCCGNSGLGAVKHEADFYEGNLGIMAG